MGRMNDVGLTSNRVEQVADALRGTCRDLSDEATQDEINNQAFCDLLDRHIMLCNTCNWWTDSDDINDDGDCSECAA